MSLHPLTPRKPTGAAMVAAWSAGIAAFAIGLLLLMLLSPPVAWLPLANRPQDADLPFLASLVAHEYRSALREVYPLAVLAALIELPLSLAQDFAKLGIAPALWIRGSAASMAGAVVGGAIYKAMLADKIAGSAVQHVKGPKLVSGKAAHISLRATWAKRFGMTSGIALTRGLEMPRKLLAEHLFIIGGTGAGKTTVIQTILGTAIACGDRVLLVDPKGDLTARLPTDSFAMLSLDDSRSCKQALDDDIATAADGAELLEEVVPDTNDPSWSSGVRLVGQAVVERFQNRRRRTGQRWDWTLLQKLLSRPVEDIHAFVAPQSAVAGSIIDVTRDETRKAAMSFYLVLVANALAIISACAGMGTAGATRLSIRRWLNGEGPQVLILRQSQRHPKRSAAFIRIVLKIAADAVAERAADASPKPVWFALDELAQIGKTSAIPRLAAIGRSASVRIIAAVQSPSQLTELYGEDGAQTILDNLTTKIVGRVAPGATAAEISERWIGNRTVSWWEETGYDADGKPRLERKTQDVPVVPARFLSDELGLTRDGLDRPIVKALVLGHGDIALLEWPVGQWPIRRPASIPRPTTDDV